ncbi:hypothetical protein [Streptomyces sp. NPDC088794]|uniref:hypothetical protein n=1 Tax=Streptomyces sp. NPDC088794 TaxID=3365902 RepID=UPI003813A4C5
MKTSVRTHKISGYSGTLRTATRLTEQAVKVVDRRVPGRMTDVDLVLTNERGMAELMASADVLLAGTVDRSVLRRAERAARTTARDVQACAVPRPDGSALVLVNIDRHPGEAEFAITLVHELTHVMQFSRKGVIERAVRNVRDRLRIERQSWRHTRENDRLIRQEEAEAYGFEHLANHLVPGAHS